jgi:hypothetical protein
MRWCCRLAKFAAANRQTREAAYPSRVPRQVESLDEWRRRRGRTRRRKLLQTLLAYSDYPFEWEPVGYWEKGAFATVAIPNNLSRAKVRPKEKALIDLCESEKAKGRPTVVSAVALL